MPLDIDRFAHVESALQNWDPRIKIAVLGSFVFGVAWLKTIPVGLVALVVALLILNISALPFHFVVQGLKWVNMFLMPFFLILPFSYPGEVVVRVMGLPFAWEGLRLATLIIIKANAVVLTSYAVFGSARFDVSMIAIQRLKCPKIIVQMLLFTYRYIFVLLDEMKRMDTAMRSRGFVMRADLNTLKIIGNFVGTLLVRSFEHTEKIYKAMLSKGYQGEFHSLVTFKAERKDYLKGVVVLAITAALLAGDVLGPFPRAVKGWY